MRLKDSGFELLSNFIDPGIAESILSEVESDLQKSKGGGIRNADKKFGSIAKLSSSDQMLSSASKYLDGCPKLVRSILFDKSPTNNWLVTWHQDKTVALSSKFEKLDWGPWSVKDDTHHVQPPVAVLENMVTFRIHLDDSTIENGCLKVISASHMSGVLSQDQIYAYAATNVETLIVAPALSALAMRPHILHASSKASKPSRRRILHLEYSGHDLPEGINWA